MPEAEPLTWMFWKKRRYIVVVLAFFGFFNVYSLRVNLSVAIVAMTENRTVTYANGTIGHVCNNRRKKLKVYFKRTDPIVFRNNILIGIQPNRALF